LGAVLRGLTTSEIILIAVVIVAYWRRLAVDAGEENEDDGLLFISETIWTVSLVGWAESWAALVGFGLLRCWATTACFGG
jgi:hypothetical protein